MIKCFRQNVGDVMDVHFFFPSVLFVCCTRSWKNAICICSFDYFTFSQDRFQPSDLVSSLFVQYEPLKWTVLGLFKENLLFVFLCCPFLPFRLCLLRRAFSSFPFLSSFCCHLWVFFFIVCFDFEKMMLVIVDVVAEMKNSPCFVPLRWRITLFHPVIRVDSRATGRVLIVVLRTEIWQGSRRGPCVLEFDGNRLFPRHLCRSTDLSLLLGASPPSSYGPVN